MNGAERPEDAQHDVMRHYSQSGVLLKSFIPRSTIVSRLMIENGYLANSRSGVGWYTGPASGPDSIYIELERDGTVRRFPGAPLSKQGHVTGLALTETGVFVTTEQESHWSLLRLDRDRNVWVPVALPDALRTSKWTMLFSVDDDALVFLSNDRFTYPFWKIAD